MIHKKINRYFTHIETTFLKSVLQSNPTTTKGFRLQMALVYTNILTISGLYALPNKAYQPIELHSFIVIVHYCVLI